MKIALPDGTRIYFDIYGSQQPTIVFLHGGPGLADHNLYVPFWSRLQNIAQVVFPDFRGHGLSEGWDQTDKFNLRTWAADVKNFCDQLGIIKPIVVGFSFGGWVAQEYAISYPEHPGAVILCNTEAHVDVEIRALAYQAKALRLGLGNDKAAEIASIVRKLGNGEIDSKKTAAIYLETCAPLFSEKPVTPAEEAVWSLCKQNPLAWEVFDRDEQFQFDHTPNLAKIIAPVLCLSGELDAEHPKVCAQKMCAKMINAKVVKHVVLKGAGDPVDHDDPEGTIQAVRDFILELNNEHI